MLIIGILALVVCVVGLVFYLAFNAMSRAAWIEVFRIMFAMGLLAFLIGAGMKSCSIGTDNVSIHH